MFSTSSDYVCLIEVVCLGSFKFDQLWKFRNFFLWGGRRRLYANNFLLFYTLWSYSKVALRGGFVFYITSSISSPNGLLRSFYFNWSDHRDFFDWFGCSRKGSILKVFYAPKSLLFFKKKSFFMLAVSRGFSMLYEKSLINVDFGCLRK